MSRELGVAKIIDNYTLVISGGKDHEIQLDDQIAILDLNGVEIKDPFSGELLGHYPLVKDKVKVIQVYEKFSICKTLYKQNSINSKVISNSLKLSQTGLISKNNIKTRKRLNIESSKVNDEDARYKSNKPIKIGDIVVVER